MNFNKVFLCGRLTKNPELKITPNQTPVCTFSIAVNRNYNKEETDFIDIVAWRNTAEFITKYFTKGNAIFIVGGIQTRTYKDSSGNNRKAFEVVAQEVDFVESRKKEQEPAEDTTTFEEIEEEDGLPF